MHYFAALLIKDKKTYSVFQLASAAFMMLALAWLTISLPYVYASQQKMAEHHKMASATTPLGGNEEEAANPCSNTTEEKKNQQ